MRQSPIFTFSTSQRKASLISHISFSIGWFGAVVVFLALAIASLTTINNLTAHACYIAMEICTWYVILPFCVFSLLTGVVQALGTKWGLYSHYWIVVKLILTLISTFLLILHLKPISDLATAANNATLPSELHANEVINLISKSGAAILALLFITSISIYKPWGKINNKYYTNTIDMQKNTSKTKIYLFVGLGILLLFIIIKHILSGGLGHH